MKYKELKTKYAKICSSLSAKRLKPAFDLIGKLISENGLGIYYDEYRNMEETYHYMLKYTVEGIIDPERQKVYRKLIVSVFELADKINEALLLRLSPSVEYEKKRFFKTRAIDNLTDYLSESKDTSSAKALKEYQQKMRRLFHQIWFSDKLAVEETEPLHKFFLNPDVPAPYKSFMVTALMLSLQRFFDPEKFNLLFTTYDSEEAGINQRALVGLLINLYKYDARLPFYPDITGRLKILNETPRFKRNLERIIVQFIRSRETEKLQKRIRDEILPEMIKISPNLKNKINLDSLMEEGISEDKNPAWEEIFRDRPGLLNKMEEFSELQMKGSDVFLGSFAMLKSFPFFGEMDNWFMPFFPENPEIADTLDVSDPTSLRLMEAINRAPILCNSDKYSFCLSIQRIPKDNLEFMKQAMDAEMDQLKEMEEDEVLLDPGRRAEVSSNQYIQDLYRFYKLFPRKGDFEDIFNWQFDFHNKLALGDILKEDLTVLRNIGEYYFAKNHFEEAAEIFGYLLEQEKNGELYQKIAWCHQKTGDFKTALDGYLKAELYEVNQLWNLKKIALCYRNLKKPAKALKYYQAAEKLDTDNLSNHLNIGHCLLELDKFGEALKCYFKVEYLAPGNKKVWRPIAWCSFLTGKKDQAEKYFLKLIEDRPNRHDYMNMGHVQWSLGNRKSALEYYQRSISKEGSSAEGSAERGSSARESSAEGGSNEGFVKEGFAKKGDPKAGDSEKGFGKERFSEAGQLKEGFSEAGQLKEGFSEAEFLQVFEEDLPHLLDQGINSDDIPIMLDQLRYFLEGT